jgi:hypothetical protein
VIAADDVGVKFISITAVLDPTLPFQQIRNLLIAALVARAHRFPLLWRLIVGGWDTLHLPLALFLRTYFT